MSNNDDALLKLVSNFDRVCSQNWTALVKEGKFLLSQITDLMKINLEDGTRTEYNFKVESLINRIRRDVLYGMRSSIDRLQSIICSVEANSEINSINEQFQTKLNLHSSKKSQEPDVTSFSNTERNHRKFIEILKHCMNSLGKQLKYNEMVVQEICLSRKADEFVFYNAIWCHQPALDCNFDIAIATLKSYHEYLTRKDRFHVLIIGLDNAGKTTFFNTIRYIFSSESRTSVKNGKNDSRYDIEDLSSSSDPSSIPLIPKEQRGMNANTTPTVGLNIGDVDIVMSSSIRSKINNNLTSTASFHFWDLGGQTGLQSTWRHYYKVCHAVIYAIDSTDRERIDESKLLFDEVVSSKDLKGVPLLVVANKQDLPDCMGVREVRPLFEGCNLYQENIHREVMVLSASALTGLGVKEGIQWLSECVARNSTYRSPDRGS